MMQQSSPHVFAVLAYKESPFLEDCIKSVLAQKYPSKVIIATSTPNDFIKKLAQKYDLKIKVNKGKTGIGADFDFALRAGAEEKPNSHDVAPLVTIAHQDDVYNPDYAQKIVDAFANHPESLIVFPDYYELRDGKKVTDNKLLRIKHFLLWPLRISRGKSKFVKRLALRFGNPISCPAVTFNTQKVQPPLFDNEMKNDVDWHAWEILSRREGNFTFVDQKLMGHRIHADSTTTENIQDHTRMKEDYAIFQRFWPKWIAHPLAKFYSKSERSNQV